MKFYVRFTVVKRFLSKPLKALWLFAAACVIVFIASFFIKSIRFLGLYAFVSYMLAAVAQNFLDRFKKTGECALTDQEIIVTSGEGITRYPLSAITDLKLYFQGYWGMELKGSRRHGMEMPNFSDGVCNELVFRHKGEEVRIGLMFYPQHLSAMNTLFAMWEEQGISYELYGRKNDVGKRFRV